MEEQIDSISKQINGVIARQSSIQASVIEGIAEIKKAMSELNHKLDTVEMNRKADMIKIHQKLDLLFEDDNSDEEPPGSYGKSAKFSYKAPPSVQSARSRPTQEPEPEEIRRREKEIQLEYQNQLLQKAKREEEEKRKRNNQESISVKRKQTTITVDEAIVNQNSQYDDESTCPMILKQGARKGEPCGNQSSLRCPPFCSRHSPK